jgi:hypothetical protein
MAEGAYIPGTPACGEWETLLAEALDGLLNPEDEARFLAHKAACPACAALYEEARKGREWLEFLSPEPEPPEGLIERILATTGPGHPIGRAASGLAIPSAVPEFVLPVWRQPGFFARMRADLQPRLMMTAAMAFFSIALTLNLAGVQLKNLRLSPLRPQAVRSYMERQLSMASVPIVRYYDHLRFVYEVEAQVRELRGQTDEENKGSQQQKQTRPAAPGETRELPRQKSGNDDRGLHAGPPQLPATPLTEPAIGANGEYREASWAFPLGSMQSTGYMVQRSERSTPWIAQTIAA